MSKTTLNMADLVARRNNPEASTEPEKANFLADDLTITVTTPSGEVVMKTVAKPRGYKVSEVKSTGRFVGGVGWYSDVKGDGAGNYRGFGVTAGLRLSLDIGKVPAGTTVDLRSDDDSGDSES